MSRIIDELKRTDHKRYLGGLDFFKLVTSNIGVDILPGIDNHQGRRIILWGHQKLRRRKANQRSSQSYKNQFKKMLANRT